MKRIAVVLCLLMLSLALSSCTEAEVDYLNLSRQMQAQSYQVTGTITGEIDFDALQKLLDKTAANLNAATEDAGDATVEASDLFAEAPQGKQTIKVTYDARVNTQDTMSLYADFAMQVNGKSYEMGDLYLDAAKGLYLSRDSVLGFYDIYADLFPDAYAAYFYSKEYRAELVSAFAGQDYLYVGYVDGLSAGELTGADTITVTGAGKEVSDAAFTFLETAFAGFTTGTVSRVNGGYQISLDGKQGKKLIADLLQYFIDNIDTVLTAYGDYMEVIVRNMDLPEDEKAAMNAIFDEASSKESRRTAVMGLAAVKQAFLEADQEGYLAFLDGFHFKAVVKKTAAGYTQSTETSLKDGGKTVVAVKNNANMALQSVMIALPQDNIAAEAFGQAIDALENKHNPVLSAELQWWNNDSWAFLTYTRAASSPLHDAVDYDWQPYLLQQGSVYLPLRSICETFGETVIWDQAAQKAYVVRDGKQIAMTGVLQNGNTYVKIRDFEKLGYKVSYAYDQDMATHTALISK